MNEWLGVPTITFPNAAGLNTQVKFLHEFKKETANRTITTDGKDLDLIAFEQLGSELETLRLLEMNAQAISEYGFNMRKVQSLKIP